MFNFWQSIQVGGIIMGWLQRASADGKITVHELTDLMTQVISMLGLEDKLKIEVPMPPQNMSPETAEETFYKSLAHGASMKDRRK